MKRVFLTEPQDALADWLCKRIHYVPTRNLVCFGQYDMDDHKLIGAVGYDNWSDTAVEMHMAGEGRRWVSRELIYKAFSYPFIDANLNVVLGKVGSDNHAAYQMDLRLGFKEVCRIPGAWSGGADMIILAMKKEECRWLDLKNFNRLTFQSIAKEVA